MNNFLCQFGSFKKNQKGLNEYVDYLGSRYTQDPNTGMWKSNGRSLNEQMLFEEALHAQGGYGGGEEGSGGRSQASRTNYTLGFAISASQTTAIADPFANLSTTNGTQIESDTRYATVNHTAVVPIKFKLTLQLIDPEMTDATLRLRVGGATQVSFDLFNELVNAESDLFNVPVNETRPFVLRYNGSWSGNLGISSQFTIQIINAQLNTVIDSLIITDEYAL